MNLRGGDFHSDNCKKAFSARKLRREARELKQELGPDYIAAKATVKLEEVLEPCLPSCRCDGGHVLGTDDLGDPFCRRCGGILVFQLEQHCEVEELMEGPRIGPLGRRMGRRVPR